MIGSQKHRIQPPNPHLQRSVSPPQTLAFVRANLFTVDPSAMYTCRRADKTDNVIFVPTTEDSIYRNYISSTDIRIMMSKNKSNPKEITPEMASLVLGPHRKSQQTVSAKPQTREQVSRTRFLKISELTEWI